jgi:hypothetical protein
MHGGTLPGSMMGTATATATATGTDPDRHGTLFASAPARGPVRGCR